MNQNNEPEKTPLIERLKELKKRVVISSIAIIFFSSFSFYYVEEIYKFLAQPLADAVADENNRKMIFTGLHEAFFTYLKLSIFSGFILSFPVLAYQLYVFIAPGLFATEKKFFFALLFSAPILFIIGAALVYYLIFPLAWEFFLSFEIPAEKGALPIVLEAKISEYLSLVTSLILAFGLTFQLPLVIVLLIKLGLINIDQVKKFRKYAVIVILTVSAILTPPDVLSQIALAVPLYLLYEISILLAERFKVIE